jgi:hypothetical protein
MMHGSMDDGGEGPVTDSQIYELMLRSRYAAGAQLLERRDYAGAVRSFESAMGALQVSDVVSEAQMADTVLLTRLCVGARALAAGDPRDASVAFRSAGVASPTATRLLSAAVRTGLGQAQVLLKRRPGSGAAAGPAPAPLRPSGSADFEQLSPASSSSASLASTSDGSGSDGSGSDGSYLGDWGVLVEAPAVARATDKAAAAEAGQAAARAKLTAAKAKHVAAAKATAEATAPTTRDRPATPTAAVLPAAKQGPSVARVLQVCAHGPR